MASIKRSLSDAGAIKRGQVLDECGPCLACSRTRLGPASNRV